MNPYIEEKNSTYDNYSITSKTLKLKIEGFLPKFRGGCFAVIPHENKFVIFDEDDNRYRENSVLNEMQFITLVSIYETLSNEVNVKTDYIAGTCKTTYLNGKSKFYKQNFSKNMFKVEVEERKGHAPIVTIENGKYSDCFDISHVKERLECCKKSLKQK